MPNQWEKFQKDCPAFMITFPDLTKLNTSSRSPLTVPAFSAGITTCCVCTGTLTAGTVAGTLPENCGVMS